jgi:predicted RNase H-like HicB family nuclease
MRRHAVLIEKTGTGFGAYVPDFPGCVSTGRTIEEAERNIREAIEFHLGGMRQDGTPIPEPTTIAAYVDCRGLSGVAGLRQGIEACYKNLRCTASLQLSPHRFL